MSHRRAGLLAFVLVYLPLVAIVALSGTSPEAVPLLFGLGFATLPALLLYRLFVTLFAPSDER